LFALDIPLSLEIFDAADKLLDVPPVFEGAPVFVEFRTFEQGAGKWI